MRRGIRRLRDDLQKHAPRELTKAIRDVRSVAIERSDYSYRPMQSSEAHELLEAARAAHSVWLFVFAPGDPRGDNLEIVGTLTFQM
jgi:hypothetical protein